MTTRKITNLKFWGRDMVDCGNHWRLRLVGIAGHPIVRIWPENKGVSGWDILGMEPRSFSVQGGTGKARNAAQRYLEKLAADIARESVKR